MILWLGEEYSAGIMCRVAVMNLLAVGYPVVIHWLENNSILVPSTVKLHIMLTKRRAPCCFRMSSQLTISYVDSSIVRLVLYDMLKSSLMMVRKFYIHDASSLVLLVKVYVESVIHVKPITRVLRHMTTMYNAVEIFSHGH